MPSRLSLHFQTVPSWSRDWAIHALRNGGELWVKVINPPEQNPWDGLPVRVIGRFHPDDDEQTQEWIWEGATGADTFYQRWLPEYRKRPWLYAIESPNEPQPMVSEEFVGQLADFLHKYKYLMRVYGDGPRQLRVAGPNFGNGWPFVGYWDEKNQRFNRDDRPILAGALEKMQVLTWHEYSWPQMWSKETYHCLRYRRVLEQMHQVGYEPPKVKIVTEAGLDGLSESFGPGPRGWRVQGISFEEYLRQLTWYENHLKRDGVASAFVFTAGAGHPWETYSIDKEEAWRLADHIAADPPRWEPEQPKPEPVVVERPRVARYSLPLLH